MKGIPTTYKGINFRSRNEAKWACFFDQLCWRWSYEPMDLEGYIPDFLMHFASTDLLVEVKSFTRFTDDAVTAAHEKIVESGYEGAGLIVGYFPGIENAALDSDLLSIGAYFDQDGLDDTAFICPCPEGDHVALSVMQGSWFCRVCGGGHKIYHGATDWSKQQHVNLWHKACNIVQWRGQPA